MKNVKYPILVFLIIALSACQSINSNFQDPKVSINSVEIAEITFTGINLIANVDVENPNGFSIPLPKINWNLSLNSAPFVQGVVENSQSIRSRRKVTIDLPFSVNYDGLYNTFSTMLDAKETSYNLAMDITFPLPVIGDKIYKTNFSGILPLLQSPNIKSGQLEITKMDYSGIVLACMVDVENPNSFPIPFPKMDFDYSVNGLSVLKSNETKTGEIAAGATSAANFNVRIDYADVFKIVDSVMNMTEAESSLSLAAGLPLTAFNEKKNTMDIPGKLPILHRPEVSFLGIVRRSLGTTMEFVLNLEINNKNNFNFDIENFIYDFTVNNSLWAQSRNDNVPQIRAGSRTTIPLTVAISAPAIIRELVDILNRGSPVNYNFNGSMDFISGLPGLDIPELTLDLQGNTRIR